MVRERDSQLANWSIPSNGGQHALRCRIVTRYENPEDLEHVVEIQADGAGPGVDDCGDHLEVLTVLDGQWVNSGRLTAFADALENWIDDNTVEFEFALTDAEWAAWTISLEQVEGTRRLDQPWLIVALTGPGMTASYRWRIDESCARMAVQSIRAALRDVRIQR